MSLLWPLFSDFPPPLLPQGFDPGNLTLQIFPQLIGSLIEIALELAGILAVAFIILGGIRYITSSGNPKAIEGARNTIVNAIVGLALAALAYVIVGFVTGLF